jgi:hypothetical protein
MENYTDQNIFSRYSYYRSEFERDQEIITQDESFLKELWGFAKFLRQYLKKYPIKCLAMLKNHPQLSFNLFFWNLNDLIYLQVPWEKWNLPDLFDLEPRRSESELLEGHVEMSRPMLNHTKEVLFNTFTGKVNKARAFKVVRILQESFTTMILYAHQKNLEVGRFEWLAEIINMDRYVMNNVEYDFSKRTIDFHAFEGTFEKIINYPIREDLELGDYGEIESILNSDSELKGLLSLFTYYSHLCFSNKQLTFSEFPLKEDVELLFFIVEIWSWKETRTNHKEVNIWSLRESEIDQRYLFSQFIQYYRKERKFELMQQWVNYFKNRFDTGTKKRNHDSSKKITISEIIKTKDNQNPKLDPEKLWILEAVAVIEEFLE